MAWDRKSNCMGWAFQEKKWMIPTGYLSKSHDSVALKMIDTFNLKLVRKSEMASGKEYIAFRINIEDFHFMRRNASGHWTHKFGYKPVETISQKEVFSAFWETPYRVYWGKIWLFELQS